MDSLAEGENGIDWKGVKRAFVDWKTYVIAIMCEYQVYGRPTMFKTAFNCSPCIFQTPA